MAPVAFTHSPLYSSVSQQFEVSGLCNVEVTTHCHLNFHDKEVEEFLTWTNRKCASLVRRSVTSWSCSDRNKRNGLRCEVVLLLLVASLLCLGVILDKETVIRVGVLLPAPTQPHHFSTQFKRRKKKIQGKKKRGGEKKKSRYPSTIKQCRYTIHLLPTNERTIWRGEHFWGMAPSTGEVALVDVADWHNVTVRLAAVYYINLN